MQHWFEAHDSDITAVRHMSLSELLQGTLRSSEGKVRSVATAAASNEQRGDIMYKNTKIGVEQSDFLTGVRAYFKEKGIWKACFDKRVEIGHGYEGTPFQFPDHWFYNDSKQMKAKSLKLVLRFKDMEALPVGAKIIYGSSRPPSIAGKSYEIEDFVERLQNTMRERDIIREQGLRETHFTVDDSVGRIRLHYAKSCNTIEEIFQFTDAFSKLK